MRVLVYSMGSAELPRLPLVGGHYHVPWPPEREFSAKVEFTEPPKTLSALRISALLNHALDAFYVNFREELRRQAAIHPCADTMVLWFRLTPTLITGDGKTYTLFTNYHTWVGRQADIHPETVQDCLSTPEFRWNHTASFPSGYATHAIL